MSISIDTFPSIPVNRYDIVRDQIRSGDILLCSGSSFFSTLIKKATNSVWSHVAFILRLDVISRIMVLESVESIGVRTVPLSSYVGNYNGSGKAYPGRMLVARHSQFHLASINNLSKIAVDLLGYPYDKDEILRIAARIMIGTTDFKLPLEEIGKDRAYICSEYAHKCYQSVGTDIDYDPGGFVTPADFAKTSFINPISFIQTP